jgi:hypothetical protein
MRRSSAIVHPSRHHHRFSRSTPLLAPHRIASRARRSTLAASTRAHSSHLDTQSLINRQPLHPLLASSRTIRSRARSPRALALITLHQPLNHPRADLHAPQLIVYGVHVGSSVYRNVSDTWVVPGSGNRNSALHSRSLILTHFPESRSLNMAKKTAKKAGKKKAKKKASKKR